MLKSLAQIVAVIFMVVGGLNASGAIFSLFAESNNPIYFWVLWGMLSVAMFWAGLRLLAWGRS